MISILLSYTQFLFLKLKGGRGGGRGGENRVRSLGSQEKVYDQVVADMDLSSAVRGIGVIEGVKNPSDTSTKLAQGTLGIATTAAVGLYLYKKRRSAPTKNTKHSVPEPTEVV